MIWCFSKMNRQLLLYLLQIWIFIHSSSGSMHLTADEWALDFPQCMGTQQSPINLGVNEATEVKLNSIYLQNYYVDLETLAFNNGDTIVIKLLFDENDDIPSLYGAGINGVYEAESANFHWGGPGIKGSEHSINGERYDLEFHIIHRNTDYEDLTSALQNSGGLLIMAVFFDQSQNGDVPMPSGLAEFCEIMDAVKFFDSESIFKKPIALKSFIENLDLKTFFVYNGSLTTPPCTEGITWVVFTHVLPVEPSCLKKFYTAMDADENMLLNAYRPIQKTSSRTIQYRSGAGTT